MNLTFSDAAPIARNLLRVIAGGLYMSDAETALITDPAMVALILWALVESWYLLARRFGWRT